VTALRKCDVFGVHVTPTSYDELTRWCIDRAQRGEGGIVDLMPVHGLVSAARDESYRAKMNAFDAVAPDGQPVRWALNHFYSAGLTDRVYGPELTLRVCRAAAAFGVPIYLYGATTEVIEALATKMLAMYPELKIAGKESPPFRPLTKDEDAAVIERINSSGAGIVFLGIGCPKQELFAYEHRHSIKAVQLCVGAAFDFHAGNKRMAPRWMQKRGLEWLYRLCQEPKRLWKRYLVTNTTYLVLFAREMLSRRAPGAAMSGAIEAIPARE
jgi:N-acetylglucosaminyldiphosphoundecaprenol N-acetyl-beta-D-mannosaminyltransferase